MTHEALAQLAEAYLKDSDIWPLGASARVRPAVMGFAAFLAGRGVTLRGPVSEAAIEAAALDAMRRTE